jgi:integrase
MAQKRQEPLPGVDRLRSGRYRARWYDGSGERSSKTFDTVEEANAHIVAKQAEVKAGTFVNARRGEQRFHDFAVDEFAPAQDWKETTRQSFPFVLRRVESVLPTEATLAQIDHLKIKTARVELAKRYEPSTVIATMLCLNAIMRAAYVSRRLGYDPTVGTRSQRRRSPDMNKVTAGDVPTRAEVNAIWIAARAPYRAAIALGVTGLRIGEVLGLTADRVDLEQRLVVIDRQLQRIANEMTFTTPKSEKVRTIRVPQPVALELRRHIREHQGGGLLFRSPHAGGALRRDRFYESGWHPALVAAGLGERRYKFHALRHFCASSLLAAGVNPMAVAGHLGDTLETLQRVYAHWMRDDRNVPADALESILIGSPTGHAPAEPAKTRVFSLVSAVPMSTPDS